MFNMMLSRSPVANTGTLIRRPVEDVFEAIVNPEITSKFWFSKGSGRLETGKAVRWEWQSHAVSIEVKAKAIEPNRLVRRVAGLYRSDSGRMELQIASGFPTQLTSWR